MKSELLVLETYLTPEQVAKKLQIGTSTAYHWAHKGILPGLKIGGTLRFSESVVATYLNGLQEKSMRKVA